MKKYLIISIYFIFLIFIINIDVSALECRPSVNLFKGFTNLTANRDLDVSFNEIIPAGTYTISYQTISSNPSSNPLINFYNISDSKVNVGQCRLDLNSKSCTFTLSNNATHLRFYQGFDYSYKDTFTINLVQIQLGEISSDYEEFGKNICTYSSNNDFEKFLNNIYLYMYEFVPTEYTWIIPFAIITSLILLVYVFKGAIYE